MKQHNWKVLLIYHKIPNICKMAIQKHIFFIFKYVLSFFKLNIFNLNSLQILIFLVSSSYVKLHKGAARRKQAAHITVHFLNIEGWGDARYLIKHGNHFTYILNK